MDNQLKEMFDGVVVRFATVPPKFTRRMAIHLSDMTQMEVRTMILKLEAMSLLKGGSWRWFEDNGGFTKQHFQDCYATTPTMEK